MAQGHPVPAFPPSAPLRTGLKGKEIAIRDSLNIRRALLRIDQHPRIQCSLRVQRFFRRTKRLRKNIGALFVVPRAMIAAHGMVMGDGAAAWQQVPARSL